LATWLGYSVIDFTLFDPHFGTMQEWVDLIDEMHRRDMYIIADFTVGTMGDFIGFKG
jgi:alpha-1,3-glucan synthase